MKNRAWRRLVWGVAAAVGCARFPDGGGTANYTKILFRIRFEGPVRSDYFYDVALTATTDLNPKPESAPLPVAVPPNPNGRVAGRPTHLIEYGPPTNLAPYPFVLYPFPLPTNPDDADSLILPPPSAQPIVFFDTQADPNELRFQIFTSYLAGPADAQQLRFLQVQILTMNRLATQAGTGNGRYFDYLGSPDQPDFIRVDLRASGTYNNSQGASQGLEKRGDVPDPSLDIVDWSIEVQRP